MNQTPTRPASRFLAGLAHHAAHQQIAPRPPLTKHEKPAAPPPLADQVRAVLADWPETHRQKISAELLLPSLKGKYRDRPSLRAVGTALRQLGFQHVRVWRGPDKGRRFWTAPESN